MLLLGMIDLGRAFVFGVVVQDGAHAAARVSAKSNYDASVDDAVVLGRLVGTSNPALTACSNPTAWGLQPCGWTFTLSVDNGATSYSSISAARAAGALAGAQVTITARGSVALFPGMQLGAWGLKMPQISVQGQSAMVIL